MQRNSFDVKLERSEWIKLNFIIGYKTKIVIGITIIGLAMLYTVVDYLTWNSFKADQFPLVQLIFAIFILVAIPVSTYVSAAKNIRSNPWIYEIAHYDIDTTKISVKGDSYEVAIDWVNIKLIEELKNWIVIYSETRRGFFIPKRVFTKEEFRDFKEVLESVPVQKKKLK